MIIDAIEMMSTTDDFKNLKSELLDSSIKFYQDSCQKIYSYVETKFKDKMSEYERDKLVRAYIHDFENIMIGLFTDIQVKK